MLGLIGRLCVVTRQTVFGVVRHTYAIHGVAQCWLLPSGMAMRQRQVTGGVWTPRPQRFGSASSGASGFRLQPESGVFAVRTSHMCATSDSGFQTGGHGGHRLRLKPYSVTQGPVAVLTFYKTTHIIKKTHTQFLFNSV